MAYTAWSVVFGEQPTAAKWNQLGTNDAGFKDGTNIDAGAIAGTKIANGGVDSAQVAAGVVVQEVYAETSAVATGTTIIPQDDTIPQISEGTEFITVSFTPKSATNRLIIEVVACLSCDTAGRNIIGAIFKDATANALGANIEYNDNSSGFIPTEMVVKASMIAGGTSAITFRFRAGAQAASTITSNGINGVRIFGTMGKTSIVVREIKV